MHKFIVILKVHTNIAKNFTQLLVMSTESNTNVMGLKMFLERVYFREGGRGHLPHLGFGLPPLGILF